MKKILKELTGENQKGYIVAALMFSVISSGLFAYVVREPLGIAMLIYPTGFVLTSILSVQKPITTYKITVAAFIVHLLALAIFA